MRQNETSVDHELICFHHVQTIKSECGAYIATLLNGTNIPILTNVINGSVDVGSGAAYVSTSFFFAATHSSAHNSLQIRNVVI